MELGHSGVMAAEELPEDSLSLHPFRPQDHCPTCCMSPRLFWSARD